MTIAVEPTAWVTRVRCVTLGPSVVALLAALVVSAAGPAPAEAQYFGRNKVMYDDFDFRILRTDHFDIHFYEPRAEQAVRDFGRMSERWYDRLARLFQHEFEVRKPIIAYRNQPDFQQTNVIPGFISQATGGVTESLKNRVVLPFAQSYEETDHVLGHELVHAFQYDLAQTRAGAGATAIARSPLWLIEGLAEYLSLGRRSAHTAMWLRDAVLRNDFPEIADLENPQEYFPYRYGHALWAYIAGRWGDDAVAELYRTIGERGWQGAVQLVLRTSVDTLSTEWREATFAELAPPLDGRTVPVESGEPILVAGEGEQTNLAPELSPDGNRMVVLSQQDPFSIDLYLVDARSGDVLGELASANRNPHFEALSYVNTSGAWSPDGAQFAFVTYEGGQNEIAVANVEDRSVVRTYGVGDIGAVFGLAWEPNGARIAFAGSREGVTDLFLLDVESGDIRALTQDRNAEWHPSWSPDGTQLLFATDRGPGTDFEKLTFQRPGVGVMDVASGRIEVRRWFASAKHIDPSFSPDGRSIYFVSGADGFNDVYRADLATDRVFRVTHVATGVSGLTDLAPALTVASESGRIAFTVFDDGGFTVVGLEPEQARGEVPTSHAAADAAVLPPPRMARLALVEQYLDNPVGGLPPATPGWEIDDYDSDLQFDYIAQPTVGIGVDRFGTALGGSVAAFFSDMLGNRQLGVGISANGSVQDVGGQAIYMDRGQRWNWGLVGGRTPYRSGFTQLGTIEIDGTTARTVDLVINRTIINRASALVEYPFSETERLEAQLGGTHIAFDREIQRDIVLSGQVLDRQEIDLADPEAVNLAQASLAFVQDNSVFGFAAPVDGSRMRLEAEANVGTLDFVNGLADARQYIFLQPLTLAFRGLHYGRYGADAESDRLTPLFLGHGTFVRGYTIGSFDGDECTEVPGEPETCPEFERLVGSRIAVANAELRIPLLGTQQFGLIDFPYLPTELAFFADAGIAWTSDESPSFELTEQSIERIPVFSAGAAVRVNLLGRMVLELYYAYPFQRPDASGQFGFQIAPGW